MSKKLKKCAAYFRVILEGDKVQTEALLRTATDRQVDCIGEIFRNLSHLKVTKKTKRLLDTYKKVIAIIADTAQSIRRRLKVIRKNAQKVAEVLLSIKAGLLRVVI